ncbi:hypothetical protein EMCRGX_G008598 [Ephydatia muelleri]
MDKGGLALQPTLAMLDKMLEVTKLYTQQIRSVNDAIESALEVKHQVDQLAAVLDARDVPQPCPGIIMQ